MSLELKYRRKRYLEDKMRILEKTENSLESVNDEVGSSYSRTLSIECL